MPPRKWHVAKPCAGCPFRRTEGAVRLSAERIREIAGMMLSSDGGVFHCHETTQFDDEEEYHPQGAEQHCAGALIFAEKHGTTTQMMRIVERLGGYNAARLMGDKASVDAVFDSLEEMLATAIR